MAHAAARNFEPPQQPYDEVPDANRFRIKGDFRFWLDWCERHAPFQFEPLCWDCAPPRYPDEVRDVIEGGWRTPLRTRLLTELANRPPAILAKVVRGLLSGDFGASPDALVIVESPDGCETVFTRTIQARPRHPARNIRTYVGAIKLPVHTSVTPAVLKAYLGSLARSGAKGAFLLTTSNFSEEARRSMPPVADEAWLVADGTSLADWMITLRLGTEQSGTEHPTFDPNYFNAEA